MGLLSKERQIEATSTKSSVIHHVTAYLLAIGYVSPAGNRHESHAFHSAAIHSNIGGIFLLQGHLQESGFSYQEQPAKILSSHNKHL
jgi:hypothetical protein